MTYGGNSAALRAALTELLSQHRIQQRLGGPGIHTLPVTTTPAQREELGGLIRRYRQTVLTWCHQATLAADVHAGSDPFATTMDTRPRRADGPVGHLRHALHRAATASTAELPSLEELTTRQPHRLVETWRQIARAAALGEHDFDPRIEHGLGGGLLSAREAMMLAQDVAAITQALVILDRRYARIPGWQRLDQHAQLGWAALATALEATADQADYTIDERGWKPPAQLIRGPAQPGILGVLQAEHNLLIRLNPYPRSTNLKLVVDSQRILSADLATRIGRTSGPRGDDPQRRHKWLARAKTYDLIHRELRNFTGDAGHGAQAAAEAGNALSRLRRIPGDTHIDPRVLTGFDKLFTRIDTRIADIIDHGLEHNALYLRVRVPRLVDNTGEIVHPVRERYVPVTSPVQTDLPQLVRERLRPPLRPSTAPAVPPGAARNRADLQTAPLHQPPGRDGGIAM